VTDTPAQDAPPTTPRPRRRKPPRRVTVTAVSKITPRLVSVEVTGDDLDGFAEAAPTAHLKVLLPPSGTDQLLLPEQTPEGQVWSHDESLRPVMRTYTPRRYDPATKTLEIQFVLHGVGPASEWAERVKPGDEIAVAGPGGRFTLDPTVERWWMAADESALPAVGTLLDALPETASAEVHVEVEGPGDEIELPSAAKTTVTWHYRRAADAFGAELTDAARDAVIADGTRIWVACEAATMRGIRRHFARERGLPVSSLVTRGYWRIGESNHPDHDYGED
jgi:NADPH-dependent ferric siderophore reductase